MGKLANGKIEKPAGGGLCVGVGGGRVLK